MSDTVEAELIRWGESQPDVQAILLTSTRALENAAVDWFSDYDVIVMTSDIQSRQDDREWLETFGEIVISWWDPLETDPVSGLLTAGNVVYYPEARKIDFTLWPPEMAARIERDLPTEMDAGYKVLLDKSGLTADWPSATGEGYRKHLPSCEQYLEAVNDFFIGVPYVVTALIRGEMLPAKWVLDYDMRYEYLLPMLEWYAAYWDYRDNMVAVRELLQHVLTEATASEPEIATLRFTSAGGAIEIGGEPVILIERSNGVVQPLVFSFNIPIEAIEAPPVGTIQPTSGPVIMAPTADPANDTRPPEAQFVQLPATSPPTFTVAWQGTDNSGIASYTIWVRENGQNWRAWLETSDTQAAFSGQAGGFYEFDIWAVDLAGNWSNNIELQPRTSTTVE